MTSPTKAQFPSRTDSEILSELDKKSPKYRRGWPRTLPPLPLNTQKDNAHSAVSNADAHLTTVHTILKAQGIEQYTCYFAFRTPCHIKPKAAATNTKEYLTLVIETNLSTYTSRIETALIRIRSVFATTAATSDLNIEFVDPGGIPRPYTFAIDGSEKSVLAAWQPLYKEVLEVLKGHEWMYVDVLHRGLEGDKEKCPVTVMITSSTAGEDVWWNALVPELERRVQAVLPGVEIEVLYGAPRKGGWR